MAHVKSFWFSLLLKSRARQPVAGRPRSAPGDAGDRFCGRGVHSGGEAVPCRKRRTRRAFQASSIVLTSSDCPPLMLPRGPVATGRCLVVADCGSACLSAYYPAALQVCCTWLGVVPGTRRGVSKRANTHPPVLLLAAAGSSGNWEAASQDAAQQQLCSWWHTTAEHHPCCSGCASMLPTRPLCSQGRRSWAAS